MSEPKALPQSLLLPNGSLIPFEPEMLCRQIFTATEKLDQPNSFLARELTDSVLFFLIEEYAETIPTWNDFNELVMKTIRELGQPKLAEQFWKVTTETFRSLEVSIQVPAYTRAKESNLDWSRTLPTKPSRQRLNQTILEEQYARYTKECVYPRELLSAHQEELLWLTDWHSPLELAGGVLPAHSWLVDREWNLLEAIRDIRDTFGQFLSIDSPEYHLNPISYQANRSDQLVRELTLGLENSGLMGLVHLNASPPIDWTQDADVGPLFAGIALPEVQPYLAESRWQLLDQLHQQKKIRVYWHLLESSFAASEQEVLHTLATRLVRGDRIGIILDRPKQEVILGPGIDRKHPIALGFVATNIGRLVDQLGDSVERGVVLQKVASLARFAKSVGHIRQDFLRKNARNSVLEGFRLDRSKLIIYPWQLLESVGTVLGMEASSPKIVADFAREILSAMQDALAGDSTRFLATCLDGFLPLEEIPSFYPMHFHRLFSIDPWLPVAQQITLGNALALGGYIGPIPIILAKGEADPETLMQILHSVYRSAIRQIEFVFKS